MQMAANLGVSDNIQFVDAYVENSLLLEYLAAADVYVTPYLNEAQITSGTLAYAIALGKPIVSTPYWHALEAVTPEIGDLVPFGSCLLYTSQGICRITRRRTRRTDPLELYWRIARNVRSAYRQPI